MQEMRGYIELWMSDGMGRAIINFTIFPVNTLFNILLLLIYIYYVRIL
jgi:hypothetical protein